MQSDIAITTIVFVNHWSGNLLGFSSPAVSIIHVRLIEQHTAADVDQTDGRASS